MSCAKGGKVGKMREPEVDSNEHDGPASQDVELSLDLERVRTAYEAASE